MRAFVHIVSQPARSSAGLLCHIQKCVDVVREEMNGTMLESPNLVHVTNDVPWRTAFSSFQVHQVPVNSRSSWVWLQQEDRSVKGFGCSVLMQEQHNRKDNLG